MEKDEFLLQSFSIELFRRFERLQKIYSKIHRLATFKYSLSSVTSRNVRLLYGSGIGVSSQMEKLNLCSNVTSPSFPCINAILLAVKLTLYEYTSNRIVYFIKIYKLPMHIRGPSPNGKK